MALRSCGRPGRSGCTTTTTRSYSAWRSNAPPRCRCPSTWRAGSGSRSAPSRTPVGASIPKSLGSRRWKAASTQLPSTTRASARSTCTTGSGTAPRSFLWTGYAQPLPQTPPPIRMRPISTSGGSISTGQGASMVWETTASTSTWPPTRIPLSFASVATGVSTTTPGSPPSATLLTAFVTYRPRIRLKAALPIGRVIGGRAGLAGVQRRLLVL